MNTFRGTVCALALSLVLCSTANAAVGVDKSFAPNSVVSTQPSALTIVLLNPNAAAATGVALTDTLPTGVVVATPLVIGSNTCGFTVTGVVAGANTIPLSGGTIPALSGSTAGTCQIQVNVVAASPNTYLNTISPGAVTSSQGTNSQSAQATLVVSAPSNVTGAKVFAPTNVHGGGTPSTLTITLTNPNAIALTGAAITDTLPAAITIASPSNAATTCGAGTATATGTSPATIALSGGTIPASGSCTLSVSVIATNPDALLNGNQTNTIAAGALQTDQLATSPAISANIDVQTGGSIAKAFSPALVGPPPPAGSGGASTLTITVTNFNATALTPITFTDTLPATITATALPVSTCGGTISTVPAQPAAPPYTAFTVSSGSAPGFVGSGTGSNTCTITVPVTATATGTNTLPANNYGGVAIAAASGTLSVSGITGSKTFSTPALQSGSTTMTVTLNNLTNTDAVISTAPVGFTDLLTTLGTGFTVGGAGTSTCGGMSINAPLGGTSITATGGTIPANSSCTITIPVAISATATTGTRTNTIAVNGVKTNQGNNTVTITGTVAVQRALTVTKAFAPATIEAGTVSRLTVTMVPTVNLTGVGFTDLLTTMGAGFLVAPTPNAVATGCGTGTVTATAGANNFSLSGGTLTAGTNCTVAVNVATPATAGTFTNTIPLTNIVTDQGVTETAVTANLVLIASSVTVNKSFSPTTVAIGNTTLNNPNYSTLAIQIRNNNAGAINLTGVGLTDNLISLQPGLVVANPPTASFTGTGCAGATITAPFGATQIVLSGATVNAAAICTLSVRVVGTISGNLINSVTPQSITSTQGVTNPLQGTATLAVTGSAKLSISKTDGVTTAIPGGTTTYTIVVSNAGPNDVTGLGVNDTPPAGMTFTSWTCTSTAGSICPASGSGPIATTVTVLNGGSATFTVNAAIAPSAIGTITNTVSLAVPGSVIDTNPVSSASDTDTLTPMADLAISKSDGVTTAIPGGTTTYTIVVSNNGPSNATGATVTDNLPSAIISDTFTAVGSGGASGFTASGSGNINDTVNLPVGGTITYTLIANIASSAIGTLVNTATVTAPTGVTDPNLSNNSATDTDTLMPQADLAITKTDGVTSVNAGGMTTYTIVVSNGGLSVANGAVFTDPAVANLSVTSVTCGSPSGGAACPTVANTTVALMQGAGIVIPTLPPGGSVTFTVKATVAGTASGSITNTAKIAAPAGVTDPNLSNNSATDTDTINLVADLAITKTDGVTSVDPGGTTTYTIVVSNSGPSNVTGATVADILPPAISSDTFTAVGSGGASGFTASGSGNINDTVNLPVSGTITYTLHANIASSATGTLVNTATVTAPTGVTDPNPGNNTATDTDTLTPQVTLAVVKTDGSLTYTPGGIATYTVTITDTGASDAANVTLSDALPPGVTLTANVTCVANGSANCGTVNGSIGGTSLGTTGATLSAGMGNSLVFTVPVAFASDMTADPLVNTATATDVASGATASGTDSDTLASQVTLAVAKTDGSLTYTPGGTATYTVTVTHGGLSDATDVTVSDALPPGVTLSADASCVANGNASCGTLTGLAGQTSFGATGAQIAAGAGNSLVFTVPVAFDATMTADPLDNTATATDLPSGATGSGTDSDARSPQVSLSVNKTDGSATYTPGGTATYTITVIDNGLTDALNVSVADSLPAGVTLTADVTCVATGSGASCGTVAGTTGQTSFSATGATIGPDGSSSLVFTVPVAFDADLLDDPLVNAATANDLASGATGSGSDSDTRAASAGLTVTKTDGSATYTPGGTATYSIVVTNAGPSDTTSTTVTDPLPSGVTLTANATCVASGSANCGTVTGTSGQASLGTTGASIAAGAGNSLTFTAPVAFASDLNTNPLVNTVTVTDPASATPATASDSDTLSSDVDLAITKTDGVSSAVPGGTTTYTIAVTNAGPSDAVGATVSDLFAAVISSATWTCAASGGGSCTASGSGNISDTVNVPVGATLTYTVLAVIAPSATGTLVNTATVTPPSGVTDTNPGNNSASDTDTLTPMADLAISKSDGVTTAIPGGTTTYTIVVSNNGPSNATGATVTDNLPSAIISDTFTAVGSGGASGFTASGSGNINDTVNLPVGGTITYTLIANIASSAIGTLVNTATVTAPTGVTDPNLSNNSATDTDTLMPQADLAITKTDGVTSVNAGGMTTYTITVSNGGPSNATGAPVTDILPPSISSDTFTAVGSGGASGFTASGSGNINDTVNLPVGGTITYTLIANIASSATGTLANTATVTAPAGVTDPNLSNNSATDTDTINLVADLAITKTDGVTSVDPGGTTTYTIVVSNSGPSNVTGATVADILPPAISSDTFTAVGSGGASGFTASGSGNINDTVNLPVSGTITYTLHANIASSATGTLVNTATVTAPTGVTDPNPGNNTATDTDTLTPQVTLAVVKTDGSLTYTPGGIATYTVTITDTGASDAANVTLSDALPPGVTLTANVTCVANGSANCGTVNGSIGGTSLGTTGATLSAGMGNSLVFTVPVAFASDMTADPLVNTATATDVASGATASGTDSDTLASQVTLAVAKTDGSLTYTPGGTATYTVTVTHGGLSDATDVTVSDALPPGVTLSADASCVANGNASCGTLTGLAGQTSFGATGAQIAAGAGNSLVFTVPVAFDATMTADPLDNTATATDLPSGATGSGTDSDARSPQVSLSVNKTDGSATYTPGGTATYTITVIDNGLTDALNVSVADSLPAGVTLTADVTCVATGSGASCGTVAGTTGQTSFSATGATIGPDGSSSLVFTVPVAFDADLLDDPLVNAATANDLASGATGSGSDSDTRAASADLAITKTDGVASVMPGGTTTYTIVVSNNGPSDVTGATVTDFLPPVITSDTFTAVSSGGASGFTASGSGNIDDTVNLPLGSTITYTLIASIDPSATGTLVNTATVTVPQGVTDPDPSNNSATDTDSISALLADLAITKTDGVTSVSPGATTTYTIVVTNAGPAAGDGAVFTDPAVANLGVTGVTCGNPSDGAACPNVPNTTVALMQGAGIVIPTLPSGGAVTFMVSAMVAGNATGSITNTANIATPAGVTDPNLGNNTASDTDTVTTAALLADLAITKTDGVTSVSPGATTTYTIVVTNAGPDAADGAVFSDPAVANLGVTSVICGSPSGGAACPTVPNTTVALMQGSGIVIPTLPSGGAVTFMVGAMVAGNATGSITNTANIAAPAGVTDPNLGNNTASDTNTVTTALLADLAITKTDGVTSVSPGATTTYTIVVTNAGPSAANGATFTDPSVANLGVSGVTCGNPGGGAACPTVPNTTVALMQGAGIVIPTLPSGGAVTFMVSAMVAGNATGSITNTASIAAPAGVTDPNLGNNSASDTNTVIAGKTDNLTLVKTDGRETYKPGSSTIYTITVINDGPAGATNLTVSDNLPSGVTLTANATCAARGVATCGSISSAPGGTTFSATGATIAAGTGNRLVYSLPVRFAANLSAPQITNVATATDPTAGTAAASDTNTLIGGAVPPEAIPADDRRALLLLGCLIVLFAWRRARAETHAGGLRR